MAAVNALPGCCLAPITRAHDGRTRQLALWLMLVHPLVGPCAPPLLLLSPHAGRWSTRWSICRVSWPTSARGAPRPACWTTSRCGGGREGGPGSGEGAACTLEHSQLRRRGILECSQLSRPGTLECSQLSRPAAAGRGCTPLLKRAPPLQVDVYGDRLPLKACGSVSVRDPQLLVITVFDQDVRRGRGIPGTAGAA